MYKQHILLFDLGSTLIDESECEFQRISNTVDKSKISDFQAAMIHYAKQNQNAYSKACQTFGLPKAPWQSNLERLYPGVSILLERLSKHFQLGILANQKQGLPDRLQAFGISSYFSLILGSGDFGISKPDIAIFKEALRLSEYAAENAVMIGDRLDNDILPAQTLGMKTIWVKQGLGAYGNPDLLPFPPSTVINSIQELPYSLSDLLGVSPM